MTIDEALAGEAGIAGVQWVLYGAPMQRVLQETVTALLEPPAVIHEWRLLRAKVKPGRKLTAYYELTLDGVAAGVAPTRAMAVTWTAPGANKPAAAHRPEVATTPVTPMEAEALSSGVAAPFHRLFAVNAEWRLQVEISPLDPTFPQLVRVATPAYVTALLAAHREPGLPLDGAPANDYRVTTVRYRPRQRHVLRYDAVPSPTGITTPPPCFAKLCQDDEGETTWAVVAWIADQLAMRNCAVTALRPQAWRKADQLLLYPYAPGTPVSHLLSTDQPVLPLLHKAGMALRALHDAPPPTTLALPRKNFAGEVKATLQAGEQLSALAPTLHNTLCTLLSEAQERYARLPAAEPVFTHSDFKADHLLAGADGLTLIDFDSCALTDPAADVGKLLADLQWWHALGGHFDLPQAQAAFLAGYGLENQPERLARARLYAPLIFAKNTVRRLNLFDTQWLAQSGALLEQAAGLLAMP